MLDKIFLCLLGLGVVLGDHEKRFYDISLNDIIDANFDYFYTIVRPELDNIMRQGEYYRGRLYDEGYFDLTEWSVLNISSIRRYGNANQRIDLDREIMNLFVKFGSEYTKYSFKTANVPELFGKDILNDITVEAHDVTLSLNFNMRPTLDKTCEFVVTPTVDVGRIHISSESSHRYDNLDITDFVRKVIVKYENKDMTWTSSHLGHCDPVIPVVQYFSQIV